MRTAALVLSLLLVGCATTGKVEPLPVPERSAVPASGPYVENGAFVAGPPLPGLHFAPSEGTCAPRASPLAFTACCGGKACNGHCVYDDKSGASVCSCFGEVGGCKEGLVCSKLAHKCVKGSEVKPR